MNTSISFLAAGLSLLGVLFVFGGFAFALSSMDQKTPGALLAGLWRRASDCEWALLFGEVEKLFLTWLDKIIQNLFEVAERKPLLDILYLGLIILFIPVASAINALLGGSPFLIKAYLGILVGFVLLAIISQLRGPKALVSVVSPLLALLVGLGLFIGAPLYVLTSFTERILHEKIAHAFLFCLLIAPFYYVASFSVMNFLELFFGKDPTTGRTQGVLFVRRFLAAIPVSFVLVFMAILLGQLTVKETAPFRTVQMLLASISISAFSLPAAMCAMSPVFVRAGLMSSLPALLNGLITAMGLSIALLYFSYLSTPQEVSLAECVNVLFGFKPDGTEIYMGPDFWVMHIPFAPVLCMLVFCLAGILAKLLSQISWLRQRPEIATAGLFGLFGIGLFFVGRWLA